MSRLNKKSLNQRLNLSADEFDELVRPAPERVGFDDIVETAMSRRDFFKGGVLLLGSGLFVQSALVQAMTRSQPREFDVYTFKPVKANNKDTITLPDGYHWKPLVSWGDPLWSKGADFINPSLVTSQTQALAFGDNNDGMKHFKVDGRELLAINNEYVHFSSFFSHRKRDRKSVV